jgi:hypothetical protein
MYSPASSIFKPCYGSLSSIRRSPERFTTSLIRRACSIAIIISARIPTLVASGLDPVVHYLLYGSAKGRNPPGLCWIQPIGPETPMSANISLSTLQHYELFGRRAPAVSL